MLQKYKEISIENNLSSSLKLFLNLRSEELYLTLIGKTFNIYA